MFKEAKTNRFLFAKSEVFLEQVKPYCSVPRGHLLEEGGHSHCWWMVKQMGIDSTGEKQKEVGGINRGKKLVFDAHKYSITVTKLV